jgi:hypothetical protein
MGAQAKQVTGCLQMELAANPDSIVATTWSHFSHCLETIYWFDQEARFCVSILILPNQPVDRTSKPFEGSESVLVNHDRDVVELS